MSGLLSICIPVHEGRRQVVEELIGTVERELLERPSEGDIEICVSDNASSDGTEALCAALAQRLSCELRYRRSERDLGLPSNMVSVIEMARGDHCCIMSSDDHLAPGALRTITAAIDRTPGVGGYVFPLVEVNAADPSLRTRQPWQLASMFPSPAAETVYTGLGDIVDEVGDAWIGISWNVLAREPLTRVVRRCRERAIAHPLWPQVILFAALAAETGSWAWCPGSVVVRRRQATQFIYENVDSSLVERWAQVIGALGDAWADALGGRGAAWRQRMAVMYPRWASRGDVIAAKLYERPSLGAEFGLALAYTRMFAHVPAFWSSLMPALATPGRAVRTWHNHGRHLAGRFSANCDAIELAGELPTIVDADGVANLRVCVRNGGGRVLPAFGPRMVSIEQRWRPFVGAPPLDADAVGVDASAWAPTPVRARIPPGATAECWVSLLPPRDPGDYVLELVPRQCGVETPDAAGVTSPLIRRISVRDGTSGGPA